MIEEFKKFIMRGNVLDMAVGIIIGAAFGKIVTSFVNDILMPPIGLLLGRAVVDFLIVAFAIFLLIKQVNRLMPKKEAKAARLCPYCRQEIADDATRCPHCTSELPAEAK